MRYLFFFLSILSFNVCLAENKPLPTANDVGLAALSVILEDPKNLAVFEQLSKQQNRVVEVTQKTTKHGGASTDVFVFKTKKILISDEGFETNAGEGKLTITRIRNPGSFDKYERELSIDVD